MSTPTKQQRSERWLHIQAAAGGEAIDAEFLIYLLRMVGIISNNPILKFLLQSSINEFSVSEKHILLEDIIAKLNAEDFGWLLALIGNKPYEPAADPKIKIKYIPEHVFHEKLRHAMEKIQAARSLMNPQDEYYAGSDYNYIRKFYTPLETDDAAMVVAFQEAVDNASDLSDYLPREHHFQIFDFSAPRPPLESSVESAIIPFAGAFGIYQAAYSTAVNNSIIRDAFTQYKKAIENLEDSEIEAILSSKNPAQQLADLKLKARTKMEDSIFLETFGTGTSITVFFSTILGVLLGPWAPLALIAVGVGAGISAWAGYRNKIALRNKINKFIENEEIDQLLIKKIHAYKKHKQTANPALEEKALHKVSFMSNMISLGTRIATVAYFPVIMVSPIIFSIAIALRTSISWRTTNLHLRAMRRNPLAAMHAAMNVDIEEVRLTALKFDRNEFRKYLFDELKAPAVRELLDAQGIQPPKSSTLERNVRKVMSALGIWENEENNAILEALYDGANPEAIKLLEKLRNDCKQKVFRERLEAHLMQYGKGLGIITTNLADLEELRKRNMPEAYNLLMRSYLEHVTLNNTDRAIRLTSFGTTISVAVIFVALAATFSPIGPAALAAIPAFLLLGYGIYKLVTYFEKQKMQKALHKVSEQDFTNLLDAKTKPSTFLAPNKNILPSYQDQALRTKITAETPKHALDLGVTMQDLCKRLASSASPAVSHMQFVTNTKRDGSMQVLAIGDPKTLLPHAVPEITIFKPKKDTDQTVSLHQGSVRGWQLFLANLVAANKTGCVFSLGTNLTPDLARQRAHNFIQALRDEFGTKSGVNLNLALQFADSTTALAIYNELQDADPSFDIVRAHFGLLPNIAPYTQNTQIFAKHLAYTAPPPADLSLKL